MTIPPNLVSHRANLFSAICQIASSEIGTVFDFPAREHRLSSSLSNADTLRQQLNLGPHIANFARKRPRIIGRSVFFGAKSLDLSGSPLTLDLFKTFLANKNHRVTKYDLAKRVYGIKDTNAVSSRYWAATKLNITKLISRSRRQATAYLTPNDQSIAWFSYNSIADAWELYSISDTTHPEWKD